MRCGLSAFDSAVGGQLLSPGRVLEPAHDHVGGIFDHQVHLRALVFGEPLEDMLSGILIPGRSPDSELESPEVLGTEMLFEGTNPVVAAAASRLLESETAESEIDVIVKDEQIFGVDLVVRPERANRPARIVHERVGRSEDQVASGNAGDLGSHPQRTPLQLGIETAGQGDEDLVTEIVSRSLILGPGIAEADDEAHRLLGVVGFFPAALFGLGALFGTLFDLGDFFDFGHRRGHGDEKVVGIVEDGDTLDKRAGPEPGCRR